MRSAVFLCLPLLLFCLLLACQSSPAPATKDTAPSAPSDVKPPVARAQQSSLTDDELDCRGVDAIREIRSEFTANPIRARETLIGQRLCLEGEVSGFYEEERFSRVNVAVGEEARYVIAHVNRYMVMSGTVATQEAQRAEWEDWREWMLSLNVGDEIKAECRIETFTPTRQDPRREAGIPLFEDCELVGK